MIKETVGKTTLYCANSEDVVARLENSSIDLVISSPPYNISRKYNLYNDKRVDYLDWQISFWNLVFTKMKDEGHVFLNIQPSRENPLWCYELVSNLDWQIQNTFIWAKQIEINNHVKGQGSTFKSKKYLPNGWEFVFHLSKNGETEISQKDSGVSYQPKWAEQNAKRFGKTWRPTTNIWHIPYETIGHGSISAKNMQGNHPAIFPKKLVEKCIKITGIKNGLVLDPFVGTGTTSLVAETMGLNSIGIEIDEQYYNFAVGKLKQQ
jgi:site-specific DNA-methyltransferase (adenine-specific)|tara:strand:- start:16 stop:807 length:792 start_codon:yes stop_codon:yes gene_type:complete